MQINKSTNKLKSWLFNQPVVFSLLSFLFLVIFFFIGSYIHTLLNLENDSVGLVMILSTLLAFVYPIYYMIKKLPHDEMRRNDFVAITNGATIISVVSSLVTIFTIGLFSQKIKQSALFLQMFYPVIFVFIGLIFALIFLYLTGVAVSGIYAKYKRCKAMKISPWKIILSMPFSFLMLWTPGYLIEEKNKKSTLQIKSGWYSRFNKWVLSNFNNVLFMFLVIMFFRFSMGWPTIVLSSSLLIIYTLWYVKHKSDFMKNIDNGYALTAVGINIAIMIAMLINHL